MNIRRPCRGIAAVILLAGAALASGTSDAAGYRQGACGDFTVAMIPDTQGYVDYRDQKAAGFPFDAAEQYYEQMRWIAAHARSQGGDIVFATHMGDVWQHYSRWMDPGHAARGFGWMSNGGSEVAQSPKALTRTFEIPTAIYGFQVLAGRLPFSVVPGNHDFDALWTDPAHPPRDWDKGDGVRHVGGLGNFLSAFSSRSEFFKGQPWYVASHDGGADSAQIFTSGGCRFLYIGLQYQAPTASLDWAAAVIRRHPGLPTIVATHDYLDREGRYDTASNPEQNVIDPLDNNPPMIWEKLIRQHDQIFLVLSGHVGGQSFSIATNRAGHPVWQMMADYQGRGQAVVDAGHPHADVGDGWLRLLTFHLDGAAPNVEVRTYSTHYRKFASEIPEYAAWYKAHDGQAALSDADYLRREEFTFELPGFAGRFGAPADGRVPPAGASGQGRGPLPDQRGR